MKELIDIEFSKLPLYVKPKDVANLGFSKTTVYVWFNSTGFPLIKHGRSLKTQKDKLLIWMKERELI